MYNKGKKILAWLLMTVMLCSGNSVSVFAQEMSQNDTELVQSVEETDDSCVESDDINIESETEANEDAEADIEEADADLYDSSEEIGDFSDGGTKADVFTVTEEDQTTESVEVWFSVSHDENYVKGAARPVCLTKLEVPYFDLALYGLENLYLAQGRDENGKLIPGTKETARNKVTMLHLFIYATEVLYCGVDQSDAGKGYLKDQGILGSDIMRMTGTAGSVYFTQFWGMDQNLNYYLNYEYPLALPGLGATADQIVLGDEDVVTVGHFSDWGFYTDENAGFNYLKIGTATTQAEEDKAQKDTISVEVYRACSGSDGQYRTEKKKMTGEYRLYYMPVNELSSGEISIWKYLGTTDADGTLSVNLKGISAGKYFIAVEGQPGSSTKAICSTPGGIYLTVTESVHEHQWDEGKVTKAATCKEAGEKIYTCTVCGYEKKEVLPKTTGHKYTWKVVSKATVFAPEKQKGTCSVCGKTVTRDNGKKLTATIKLNATSIKLQKKQTTKKIRVAMANGDSVRSWKSSNKKIVTVNSKGVIKAGKKTGTARITVTLASGKKATLKVKVQTSKVKTTKISDLKKNVTLKKGQKLALKPVVSPLTSQEKVTYTSSNKKVATVSKNGTITAKKKGTVKITVRSGKKSYVVKVKVK